MSTVLRTGEAIALHGRGKVRHAVAKGRWQSPHRGVIVTHNAELSQRELDLVSLKLCAPLSALGGLSALAHDGFDGFEPPHTYIVMPEGAWRSKDVDRLTDLDIVVHWSTELTDKDVHPLRAQGARARRAVWSTRRAGATVTGMRARSSLRGCNKAWSTARRCTTRCPVAARVIAAR